VLSAGGRNLAAAGLPLSFDPGDPRPLVLESRGGRRRRVAADDAGARERLRQAAADFSPHAALRPVVQAAALPVVAQVCGPSELLYLGQARGLHALLGATPPVLVPRLEATRLPPDIDLLPGDGAAAVRLLDPPAGRAGPPDAAPALAHALDRFLDAVETFGAAVGQADPGLAGKLRRWRHATRSGARRLAAAPTWRGRASGAAEWLRPRGRHQDVVLSWAAEAWREGDPAAWGRHIVDLCRPLAPPAHVVHAGPRQPAPAGRHPGGSGRALDGPDLPPSREPRHG
jgi:hypothetical protein